MHKLMYQGQTIIEKEQNLMSQRDPDILTRTENISIGAREEAGCLPISFCPQESSEIPYFHFPSFLLKGPKQGITAFLKLILSHVQILILYLLLLGILPEKGQEAQWQLLIVTPQQEKMVAGTESGPSLASLSFKSLPTFHHF